MRKRFLKRLLKALIVLFMVFSIMVGNITVSYSRVEATEVLPVVTKIAQYILSSIGAVNIGTNGGVSRVSGSLYDGLVQKVSDAMGNGVYVDSSGNYVFSNEFSNDVLSYLQGNSNIQYRVISDFTAPSNWNGIWENSQYMNTTFINDYNSCRAKYDNYLICSNFYVNSSYSRECTSYFYDLSNVSYIYIKLQYVSGYDAGYDAEFYFVDKNGNDISVPYCGCEVQYIFNKNSFYNYKYNNKTSNYSYYGGKRYSSSSDAVNNNLIDFPFIVRSEESNTEFYSNRSIIISADKPSGNGAINKQSGVFISNYNIPTISQNVVEDNDWNSIYNNYVTNVSNNYTEDNSSGEFDQTLLRKWMKNFSDNIITAIQNGDTNIAEQINYLNDWMKKIYDRLGMIYNLIDNMDSDVESGGAAGVSSPWTRQDIDDILGGLTRLESNMSYQLDEMENIYTVLTNFYNWAVAHPPTGGGGGGTPNINDDPYTPWTDIIKNMPDTDFNDIVGKWDVIKTLLQDIAPFALLGTVTASLNALSAEPVEPVFTIPLKMNNQYIDIDETIQIDFTVLEDLRTIVNALFIIMGVVIFAMFAWWLIPKLYDIIV